MYTMKGRPWGEDRFSDGSTILQKSHHSLLTMARPVEEEERRAIMGQFGHRAVLLGKHPAAMQHCTVGLLCLVRDPYQAVISWWRFQRTWMMSNSNQQQR